MTKKPNYVFDTDEELYHWGIPGQRWGNRRFQNEDGSLTPEGRERYGVNEARSKSAAQKSKAKITYSTQKYKADLKSKAKKEADTRTAREERHRVKEWAKTERVANREQAKTDNKGTTGFKFRKTKNMSDEELSKAIDRLKLQAEYNKQYVLATQPNSALVKADRFFQGETGKAVVDITKAVLPNVANTAVSTILSSKLKYANKEDREKMAADTAKVNAEAESFRAKADQQRQATLNSISADQRAKREHDLNIAKGQQEIRLKSLADQRTAQKAIEDSRIARSNQKIEIEKARSAISNSKKETESKLKDAEQKRLIEKAKQLGYRDENDPWTFVKGEAHRDSEYINALNAQLNMGKITPQEYAKLYNSRFKRK